MSQLSFFQHEDLPLFSGTAPRGKVKPFTPIPRGKQDTMPVNCTACMDTGNIGGKRCWCKSKGQKTLTLNLKGEYFDQIKSGEKTEEYRLCKPFWAKRLEGRHYDKIVIVRGYAAKDDREKRMMRPWRGFTIKTITHPHFGPVPVTVYAIDVTG